MKSCLNNSVILVTGGTGSFGKSFTEMTLKKINPKRIIIFSRDEMKQWEMAQHYDNNEKVKFIIGDVRDKNSLINAFDDVDFVVHAAATKIVPTAEINPFECVKTNIQGAMNVIEVANQLNIKKTIDPILYFKKVKSKSIIEKKIDFEFEVSQVIARDSYGNIAIYPIVRNIHENHILKHTFAPAALEKDLATKVQEISKVIIKGLNHVGVLSIEFFVTKGDVLVNEIAPRVHNSGHWTIEGCSVSQFEQHLRCVIDEEVQDPSFLSSFYYRLFQEIAFDSFLALQM